MRRALGLGQVDAGREPGWASFTRKSGGGGVEPRSGGPGECQTWGDGLTG